MEEQFTLGMMFAFLSFRDQFRTRTISLIDKIIEFQLLKIHVTRIADIVHTPGEELPVFNASQLTDKKLKITLENISFQYSPMDPFILKNVNLTISFGEFIAIVGASGSGKTTLIKIILGLLKPTSGTILINGINIEKFGLENYRNLIGTVMQDDLLFKGSIAENISFFNETPDLEKIVISAKKTAIHDEISQLPLGYLTELGEGGVGLSGGQKQRIILARAIYKAPKMLILDEATSHLDIDNESIISESINQMNLTRLVVAHRPQTIEKADKIITISHGRVILST